eukprot:4710786-Amphidinium_carterae.1
MSDNGGEFTAKPFIEGLHVLGVTLTTSSSYQPQSNGMAKRCVGLMKTAVATTVSRGQFGRSLLAVRCSLCWTAAASFSG